MRDEANIDGWSPAKDACLLPRGPCVAKLLPGAAPMPIPAHLRHTSPAAVIDTRMTFVGNPPYERVLLEAVCTKGEVTQRLANRARPPRPRPPVRATCYSCRAVTGDLMQASAGGALPRQMSHWQVSQTQSANLPTHVHRLVSTRLTTRVQK
ncbi:hypothetical protein Bbelb_221640 [Branchiostoma belcheri]|nr:hypothetical protein Bbelb_221640 [Branchiostoma belcheri]